MKALVLKHNELRLRDIPKPIPSEGEALIKVLKAGICNTDLELMKGYMKFEGVPGHEFVGRVVQTAEKKWLGKRVVGEINLFCGNCEFCRGGLTKHCPFRGILGILGKNGAFAEYLTLPVKCLHGLPRSISNVEAVFIEPLAAALEICDQVKIKRGQTVLVLGDGKLGLLISQVIKMKTELVSCVGKHRRKIEILQKRGIKACRSGDKKDEKFDVVVEATGTANGIREALLQVKPRGKIVLKSTFLGETKIDVSKIVVDEIQLIGSRCGPFTKTIDVLKKNLVKVKDMIDGDFPLGKARSAFTLAQKPGIMKVLISP